MTSYGPSGPQVWAWVHCGGVSQVGKAVPIDAAFVAKYTTTVNGQKAYTFDVYQTNAATNAWTAYLYNYTTHAYDTFYSASGTWNLAGIYNAGWNAFEVYTAADPATGKGYYCSDLAGKSFTSTGGQVRRFGAWVQLNNTNSSVAGPVTGSSLLCPTLAFTLTRANDQWLAKIN